MDEARRQADGELIERYLLGDLSPEERRQVELRSLKDQELFDTLLANSLTEELRNDPAFRKALAEAEPTRKSRRPLMSWALAIAAGLAVCGVYYFTRPPVHRVEQARKNEPVPARATPQPTLSGSRGSERPVVLAALLSRGAGQSEVFRGAGGGGHTPRSSGKIIATDGDEATVSLGSLDGVHMGDKLRVLHGGQSIGQLEITAVFRDRARGSLRGASPGDLAAIEPARQLEVLLTQAEEAIAQGNLAHAHSNAQAAGLLAAKLHKSEAKADELLGRLQALSGDTAGAAQRFKSSLSAFPPNGSASRRALLLEALAAVYLINRDTAGAQQALAELDQLTPPDAGFEVRKLNAQAILAELQGDARTAAKLYERASAAAASPAEREAVAGNAARLKETR